MTKRLIIREFQLSDFDSVHEYASDIDLVKYMLWGPNDKIETGRFFSRVFTWQAQFPRSEYYFAVTEKNQGNLLAHATSQLKAPLIKWAR